MTACYDCFNEVIEPTVNENDLSLIFWIFQTTQKSSRTTASTLETGQEHSYPFGLSILSESRMRMTRNRDYPLTSRNTYTPVLKRRYAHTIGFLPERDLLCTLSRCQRPNLLRTGATYTKKHKHRRAQRVLKKTLRIPSGRRGARPRSGRFFVSRGPVKRLQLYDE